jgi:hypothetical protein
MQQYDTLIEALNDLKARGFVYDFNLAQEKLECKDLNLQLDPHHFDIAEMYRFEGMTNPDDSSVVYAIESDQGVKGVLVNAYGVYADTASDEVIAKLHRAAQQ